MEIFLNFEVIRERENQMIKLKKDIKRCKVKRNIKSKSKSDRAITLIALVVTTIFCYDEFIKSSNNKGFLLQSI